MSPRTQEQNQALQEASKRKIIGASLELFAQHGYEGTSIRQIAERAGISKGLMYNYFESKEHLLGEIMSLGMEMAEAAFRVINPGDAPMAQLEALFRQIFIELEAQSAFWRVFYSLRSLPAFDEVLGEDIRQRNELLRAIFAGYFADAAYEEADLRAYLLYAQVEGMIQQYLLFGDRYPLADIVNAAVQLHIHGG